MVEFAKATLIDDACPVTLVPQELVEGVSKLGASVFDLLDMDVELLVDRIKLLQLLSCIL